MSSLVNGGSALIELPEGAASPIQLLSPDGILSESPDFPITLSDAELVDLYRLMVATRRLDREAVALQRQGQVGAYPPSLGQEATQVGTAFALADSDWLFPAYRELGALLVRGVPASATLHLFRGTWHSAHDPAKHRVALLCLPIATQTLHATGYAMGMALADEPSVVLTYLGDGATSEGDAHEAFNFASVFNAPVVFVIQNNQYAISVPVRRQAHVPVLSRRAAGYGVPGVTVDGNDVLACYAATHAAIERARVGGGPSIIEAVTYRMDGHSTADDWTRYRSQSELDAWSARDPIARMQAFLTGRDLLTPAVRTEIEQHSDTAAATLRSDIWDAPAPDPQEMFAHTYTNPTPRQLQQIAQLQAELDARRPEGPTP
jgi:2-oxoisovalerate dehydrogenase E1 component alpha subunit